MDTPVLKLPDDLTTLGLDFDHPDVETIVHVSKFEPETDLDRPVIGETITDNDGAEYIVRKVSWLPVAHFFENRPQPDLDGHDKLLLREHASRPAVIWTAWCDKLAVPSVTLTSPTPASDFGELEIAFDASQRARLRVLVNSLKAAKSTGEEIEAAVISAFFTFNGVTFRQTRPELHGCLTSAPLITDGTGVWGFMRYQVESFVDELLAGRTTVWTKG